MGEFQIKLTPTDVRIRFGSHTLAQLNCVIGNVPRRRTIGITEEIREVRRTRISDQVARVGEDPAFQADFSRKTEDREVHLRRRAIIGRAAEGARLDIKRVGDVARADAGRSEAAHQRRTHIEVIDDERLTSAERIDLTALQVNLADEILGDRVVPARIERFADEVGLPAEARDVLLVIDVVAGGRVFAIIDIVIKDRKPGERSDNIAERGRLLDFDRRLAVAQAVDKLRRERPG